MVKSRRFRSIAKRRLSHPSTVANGRWENVGARMERKKSPQKARVLRRGKEKDRKSGALLCSSFPFSPAQQLPSIQPTNEWQTIPFFLRSLTHFQTSKTICRAEVSLSVLRLRMRKEETSLFRTLCRHLHLFKVWLDGCQSRFLFVFNEGDDFKEKVVKGNSICRSFFHLYS